MAVATAPPRCLGPTPTFIETGDLVVADGSKLKIRKGYCTGYGYAVIWHGKVRDTRRRIWCFRSGRILATAPFLRNGEQTVAGVISYGTIKLPRVVLANEPSEFKDVRVRDGATITFIPPAPDITDHPSGS